MGGHHKKNLRAEKAKVKLKGAKLPKGLNVTKTDFKVRKIEIREQLKESSYSATGQRQLNLKETLSRLKHHSVKFRTDALRNVRDSLKSGNADHLIGHLNELFQGIAAGALDMERSARQESFKTLDILLEALQPHAVAPFFHVIATYLRCAMTHVLPAIQEDSLLMLDVLLQRVPPALLAERSASTIIGNFIDMISRARHDSERSNRTLTLNLGQGKQTTVKWRTKVLLRLQQILGTLVSSKGSKSAVARVVHFDSTCPQYYNVLCQVPQDNRDLYSILNESKLTAEGTRLQTYVEQLLPLLQDNWLEVRPQPQQPLLSQDAAASLHVVISLMSLLWTLIAQHETENNTRELSDWLRKNYAQKFLLNFLAKDGSRFPYQQIPLGAAAKKSPKDKGPADGGELCLPQNLGLVQLTCKFLPNPNEKQAQLFGHLVAYMQQSLERLSSLSPEQQLSVVASLRPLLLEHATSLQTIVAEPLTSLLSASIEAYVGQRFTTREGVATRVLNLLCEIVERSDLYAHFGGEQRFAPFLGYLPQLLLKPTVGEGTLRAMATLCRQLNGVFMSALIQAAPEVVSHLIKLQVTSDSDGEDKFENQKRVLNLFYYARESDKEGKLERALKQLEDQVEHERIAGYLKAVLGFN
ncbi:testis-expressed protein 10 homolog [Drosophila gunungcola]|uniref:Pre-rRNA-processing protein Ipi1 N-terminal domain-containing protein n=1 Tax=Drosophila gunungcola TaxID=103775 RepID=A0A9P9YE03_9MUSC|nr:testis-expressed protein 10 homolog [Drosophila gunungcola]KAI8035170.1 hypothetical protein M5D96_011981 [Drosophila gunungcola]